MARVTESRVANRTSRGRCEAFPSERDMITKEDTERPHQERDKNEEDKDQEEEGAMDSFLQQGG